MKIISLQLLPILFFNAAYVYVKCGFQSKYLSENYLTELHPSRLLWIALFPLNFLKNHYLTRRKLSAFDKMSYFGFFLTISAAFCSLFEIYNFDYVNQLFHIRSYSISKGLLHALMSFIFIQVACIMFALERNILTAYKTSPLLKNWWCSHPLFIYFSLLTCIDFVLDLYLKIKRKVNVVYNYGTDLIKKFFFFL